MKRILEPINLAGYTLPNRLVFAPLCIHLAVDGLATDALIDYYEARARASRFGLIVIEHTYVRLDGKASPEQLSAADDDAMPQLAKLASAIHRHGTIAILQLNHAGNASRRAITGSDPIGPSAVYNPRKVPGRGVDEVLPRELTVREIDELVDCFVRASLRAQKAGFDGVEIHSAHGYLLSQFYSPLTNIRTDEYSGSTLEGRTLFQRRIAGAVRKACGEHFIISLRWGMCDYMPGGADEKDIPEATGLFAGSGIDMISVSGGMNYYFKPGHTEEGWFSEETAIIKRHTDLPVLLTAGIRTPGIAEGFLQNGAADMIGIARPVKEDPGFADRFLKGNIQ